MQGLQEVVYNCCSSTSNMLKHITVTHITGVHSIVAEKSGKNASPKTQRRLMEFTQPSFEPKSTESKRITQNICEFIIRDLKPINTVDVEGFRLLISGETDALFAVVTWNDFDSDNKKYLIYFRLWCYYFE